MTKYGPILNYNAAFLHPLAKGPRQHHVAAATGTRAGVARAAGACCARSDGGAHTVVGAWDEVAVG